MRPCPQLAPSPYHAHAPNKPPVCWWALSCSQVQLKPLTEVRKHEHERYDRVRSQLGGALMPMADDIITKIITALDQLHAPEKLCQPVPMSSGVLKLCAQAEARSRYAATVHACQRVAETACAACLCALVRTSTQTFVGSRASR